MRYTARTVLALSVCVGALGLQTLIGTAVAQACRPNPTREAPQIRNLGGAVVPNNNTFTIVLEDNPAARNIVATLKGRIETIPGVEIVKIYDMGLSALVVRITQMPKLQELLKTLNDEPCFDFIQLDRSGTFNAAAAAPSRQMDPPNGLDRIDQESLPLNQSYSFSRSGGGVHVYVVDSGIDVNHPDFEGRASSVYTAEPGVTTDCAGHGTAVAGVIGGRRFGVAKQVSLHSVRVGHSTAGCNYWPIDVRDAIYWLKDNAQRPAVVNVSVGFNFPDVLLDHAVGLLIESGVTVVVAAGNDHQNVGDCKSRGSPSGYSPARVREAITVGAAYPRSDDELRDPNLVNFGSNFGSCVDLYAPGAHIETARAAGLTQMSCNPHPGSMDSVDCMGTSFAAPHVAGCAALFLQTPSMANPMPADVWAWLSERAVSGKIKTDETGPRTDVDKTHGGTPNMMLHCAADTSN
jgi:subtilisin family serine protease